MQSFNMAGRVGRLGAGEEASGEGMGSGVISVLTVGVLPIMGIACVFIMKILVGVQSYATDSEPTHFPTVNPQIRRSWS
jgi:hypothetical protein